MLRTAGPTAGPYGRKFFVDTHGWPGGIEKKNPGQRCALQLVTNTTKF